MDATDWDARYAGADLVWSALSLADHPELALEAATLLPAWADDDE